MATCLQLGQSIISIITRVRLQQSTHFKGLVFHCYSIKCRKMMVLCVIPIEGLSTSKPVHDLPHYYTDVPPVSVGVKGPLVPARVMTTNPTKKRKIDGRGMYTKYFLTQK